MWKINIRKLSMVLNSMFTLKNIYIYIDVISDITVYFEYCSCKGGCLALALQYYICLIINSLFFCLQSFKGLYITKFEIVFSTLHQQIAIYCNKRSILNDKGVRD